MLASRTIISATGVFSRTARLFELCHNFLFVYIGEGGCQAVCRCSEFGHVSRPNGLSWGRDIDTKSLSAPGHGDGYIGLQKPGNLLAKLAHPYLDCTHRHLHVYTSEYPF